MISGEWTGTMNLTEPQAGSDLALVRTRAEPQPDGTHLLFGTKIFITYGEHDMASNIVHLVLARVAGAPQHEGDDVARSEEHTSGLQSHSDLVCRLLLVKKKKSTNHDDLIVAPQ